MSDFHQGSAILDATQWITEALDAVLNLINDADVCSVLVLIAILFVIGQKLVSSHPSLQAWGYRLATGGFIAYSIYGYVTFGPAGAYDLLLIVLRGLLAAGLILAVSWTVLPIVAFLYRYTIGALLRGCRDLMWRARVRAAQWKARREDQRRRRAADLEWERTAPQREVARREAEERARAQASAQKRREDIRASCELLYSLHAAEIGDRFPKAVFDDYLSKYLGDNHPAEYVEERARHLQDVIRQHIEKVEPPPKFKSVSEIAAWFMSQKREIEALPDEKQRTLLLARLNAKYAELTSSFMEELSP